jgi:hypothetical protein
MTLTRTFTGLSDRLDEAFRAVASLQREASDKPKRDDIALVHILSEGADTLHGWLADALEQAGEAERSVAPPVDLDRARAALAAVNEAAFRADDAFAELLPFARVAEVLAVPTERGDAWRDWSFDVIEAATHCREQLDQLARALFACWQELAERTAIGSVSVQQTNIGRQVFRRPEAAADRAPKANGGELRWASELTSTEEG